MGLGDRVSDWQVCGLSQVAGGDVLAAGLFFFDFYSQKAHVRGRFSIGGVGIGIGGEGHGTGLPLEDKNFGPWSAIECDRPFSLADLNGAPGRVTSMNIGALITFGVVFITASCSFWNCFFHSQNVGGFGTGGGAGAVSVAGYWNLKGTVPVYDSGEA